MAGKMVQHSVVPKAVCSVDLKVDSMETTRAAYWVDLMVEWKACMLVVS